MNQLLILSLALIGTAGIIKVLEAPKPVSPNFELQPKSTIVFR